MPVDPFQNLPEPLAALQFLLGRWIALSQAGEAEGGFSFELQLLGRVMVRTNYAAYPADRERAAFRHEDLMVIYADELQGLRAVYFDSEGHVIHYAGQVTAKTVVFASLPMADKPGFRLTYSLIEPDILAGKFETAQPQALDQFSPYLAWSAHRVK